MKLTDRYLYPALLCASLMLTTATACRQQSAAADSDDTTTVDAIESNKETPVSVITLKPHDFGYDHMCNGKVTSRMWSDMYFTSQEVITDIMAVNGATVRRGDALARLDTFKMAREVEQCRTDLAQAELEMKDALIGQGYDPDNMSAIPQEVIRLARLRSGYTQSQTKLDLARRTLAEATLRAPFDGVVANLEARRYNRADPSKPLCRILGAEMEVDFSILESEMGIIEPGDVVEILPYSTGDVYTGRITQINPVVDPDGMIKAVATVGYNKSLCDGLNVRVRVKKSVGDMLAVPKSAVVLRSGKPVVFTLNEAGDKAMWNYVTTGLENMTEYTITDGLTEGMTVITDGNVNLAHESPVRVKR